jgi:hypothetical protein
MVPRLEPDFRILRGDQRGAGSGCAALSRSMTCWRYGRLQTAGLKPLFPRRHRIGRGHCSGLRSVVQTISRRSRSARRASGSIRIAGAICWAFRTARREGMRAIVDRVFERTYPAHDLGDPAVYAEHRGRTLAIDPVCYAHANRMRRTFCWRDRSRIDAVPSAGQPARSDAPPARNATPRFSAYGIRGRQRPHHGLQAPDQVAENSNFLSQAVRHGQGRAGVLPEAGGVHPGKR